VHHRTNRPHLLTRRAIAFGIAAATTAGCTAGSGQDATPTAAPVATTSSQLAEPAGPNDVGAEHPTPLPYPTEDTASTAAAATVALEAMTAFAQPAATPEAWWSQLAPFLTAAAQSAYAGTDPAQVPASTITGPAVPGASPSSYLATVTVPTDVGDYDVLLVRDGAGAPWLVERLTPPADLPSS
jgi:hypothetical protein